MDLPEIILLVTTMFVCDTNSQNISGRYSHHLENYRFEPIQGLCYQLYSDLDAISTCRREPDLRRQSCIRWISNDYSCIGLITPTSETVVLWCRTHPRFNTCFVVYDTHQNLNIVCQEIYEGHAVGITTPDNFTILFHSDFCITSTSIMERELISKFVNNFSFDVEDRSCYKVYNQKEILSPYNCLSADINEVCVINEEEGCTTLTTPNDEVLLLDCAYGNRRPKQKDCFYLYSSDNQVHTVCQEKLEERCVGIVTPSNLTVLFECFFCSEFSKSKNFNKTLVYYNKDELRKKRQFVKKYLIDEYLGKNLHLIDSGYMVFKENQVEDSIQPSWIKKTSCFGFTLKNNETLLLKCMIEDENREQPGCFSLISAEKEKLSVCAEVLNEDCVGLKIVKNVSVALACFGMGDNKLTLKEESLFIFNTFRNFSIGWKFTNNHEYHSVYKKNEITDSTLQTIKRQVRRLEDRPNCLGLTTESEIIVLHCNDTKTRKNGCFNVVKRTELNTSQSSNSDSQADEVCVKVLDDLCVGILTPDNLTLSFSCFVSVHNANVSYECHHYRRRYFPNGHHYVDLIGHYIPDNKVPPRC